MKQSSYCWASPLLLEQTSCDSPEKQLAKKQAIEKISSAAIFVIYFLFLFEECTNTACIKTLFLMQLTNIEQGIEIYYRELPKIINKIKFTKLIKEVSSYQHCLKQSEYQFQKITSAYILCASNILQEFD